MKWIISTFVLLASLLAGAALWLVYADLSFLKPTLEQYIQELTGREFSIEGHFQLDVGEYVTLEAENIRLGNEAWTVEPMARVKRLAVVLDYASLLDGTIIIRELDIQGGTLFLEKLEDGRNNWTFGDSLTQPSENQLRVLLQKARLRDTAITYRAPELERPLEISIANAEQVHQFDDDSLATQIIATVNGRSIEVTAELSTFENLLEGENIEYDLRGRFDTLSIDSHGVIDDLLDPSKPVIALSVSSPNVDDVTAMLGLADYGEGGLKLDAYLTPHDDNVELTVRGNLAGLEINASGRASELRALRQAEFDVTTNGPHLGRFLNLIGIDDVPDEPFRLVGHLRRSDSQLVIDDVVLEVGEATFRLAGTVEGFPGLDAANVHLNVAGPELAAFGKLFGFPGSFTGPFELDATIEHSGDGEDVVDALLTTAPVRLQFHGPLGDPPNYAGTRFAFVASGDNLHTVISIMLRSDDYLVFVPEDPFSVQATLDVALDGIAINDLRAEVRDADISGSATATSQRGTFTAEISLPDLQNLAVLFQGWQPDIAPFTLRAQGAWNPDRLTIDSGRASLGEATLQWGGVFDYPPDLSATDLEFSARIPSLANLGTFDGERLPARDLMLNAHFDGTAESFVMDELHGSLGGTTFTGALNVVLDETRPKVAADLSFTVLDLRDWEEEEEAEPSSSTTQVIPDYRLPLSWFDAMDGTLDIAARSVLFTNVTFTDALMKATLLDGSLTVSELDIVAPRGRLYGTLSVMPTDSVADVHFTFGTRGLSLNLAGDPNDLERAMKYDVDVDLSAHGATTRELAASLSGHASVATDGGRFHNRGLSLLYSGFGRELLAALNPLAKETPYTTITCAKVSFEATDGRFETSPNIIVQTDKINLISKGTIDLATEQIDFNFNSKPRRRLSFSASELINPYIRVVGTLGQPRLTINRRGTAIAAVTAGWSILAQAAWDRTFRRKDPCE